MKPLPSDTPVTIDWELAIRILGLLDELGGTDLLEGEGWPGDDVIDYEGPPIALAAELGNRLVDRLRPPFSVGDRVVTSDGSDRGLVEGLLLFSHGWDVMVEWEEFGFAIALAHDLRPETKEGPK